MAKVFENSIGGRKMISKKTLMAILGLLVVASMVLSACATPTPEVVEKVVTKEVEKVVKETVVVKEMVEVPAEAEEITIEYWQYFFDARVDAMNRLIQQFEAENPGIHVIHTNFPYADYRDKIAASVPAGVGPDIATLYYGWLPLWVDSGYLVPLPEDEFPPSMIESEFSPLVQAGKFGGKYWAMHDRIFENQRQLPKRPWADFADAVDLDRAAWIVIGYLIRSCW